TAKEVAKGAATGAATGGWIGAARGAAVSFVQTKAGRRVIAIILAFLALLALIVPITGFVFLIATSSTADAGDMFRGGEAVQASNVEVAAATDAVNTVSAYGIPWEIYLALTDVQDVEDIDLPLLAENLEG